MSQMKKQLEDARPRTEPNWGAALSYRPENTCFTVTNSISPAESFGGAQIMSLMASTKADQ